MQESASNWPLFAEKAKQLIGQDKATRHPSVSRKSVLPVYEQSNALLRHARRAWPA